MKNLSTYLIATALLSLFGIGSVFAQYCVPTPSSTWGYIGEVSTTGGVSNFTNATGTSGTGKYNDYSSSHEIILAPGQSFNIITKKTYSGAIFIDWNGDEDFNDPGELIRTQGYFSGYWSYHTWNQPITVPANAVVGKRTRIRVMTGTTSTFYQRNPCNWQSTWSNYLGEAEDYGLFITYDNNAGVASINDPIVECNGTAGTDLNITIRNTGVDDLDTVYIGGSIIDAKTGTVTNVPLVTWSDSLETGETRDIALFTYPQGFRGGDTVCVWTQNPNNVPDSASGDDTLCYVVPTGLKGVYTVGDTAGGMHDFRSISDAVDFINGVGAICDTVVIALSDTSYASYYGQYSISNIHGTSPTSPIIFRPKDTNMYQVQLQFDSCSSEQNYLFELTDVSDVIFEDINFSTTNGRSVNYSRVISVEDAERVEFLGCNFTNNSTGSSNANHNLMNISSAEEIYIEDCYFNQGSVSINADDVDDMEIHDCEFRSPGSNAVNVSSSWNLAISGCDFSSNQLFAGGIAIRLSEVNEDLEISYNAINVDRGQWPVNGIEMNSCNALNGTSILYNNVINTGQPWSGSTYRGVELNTCVGVNLIYNTIVVNGNNNNNAALYSSNGTRNTAYNNVLASFVNGYSMYLPTAASVVAGDHNNLYAASGNIGRLGSNTSTSLSAWNAATGLDDNSVSVNPYFYNVAQNDLHVCNDNLSGAGTPIVGIDDDFEGDPRDPKNPCIGADEFAPVANFTLGDDYGLCDGDTTTLTAGKGLTGELAIWKDKGTGMVIDTSYAVDITMPGNYEVTLLNACGISVDSIEIIAPAKVVLPGDSNLCPMETVTVDASITNGSQYMWSTGATTPSITLTAEGKYSVTTTDLWSCKSEDSISLTYSNAADMSIDNDTSICEGGSISVFGGTDPNTEPNVSYRWFGWNGASSETGANPFINFEDLPNDTNVVVCELTHRGCVTTDTLIVSKQAAARITGLDIQQNGQGLYVYANASTGNTHHWDFGDGKTSNWADPRHQYDTTGVFTVTYTNSNICGSVDTFFTVDIKPLSLVEGNENSAIAIYPNPSNGSFNVDLNDLTANEVSIIVVDAQGRTVYNEIIGAVNGHSSSKVTMDVTAGVYFVRINIDGNTNIAKVTVK